MYKKLAEMRDADAQIRETVVQLEFELCNEAKVLEDANAKLIKSKAVVSTARGQMLSLKTPRLFEDPKVQSVPPLDYPSKDICAYCGFGFVHGKQLYSPLVDVFCTLLVLRKS